jgi:hypothetical protein
MAIDKLPDWLRSSGGAFVYWIVFLLALEPGNVLHASRMGHALAVDREALRIGVAALLGCSTAPLILALNRRYPILGTGSARYLAIHVAGAAVLAGVLILVSCVLAAWILMGKALPSVPEIRSQLAANGLLLTFALSAFAVLSHAMNQKTSRRAAMIPVKTRGRLLYLDLASIEWIEAQGNYLALHVGDRSHLVRATLRAFATRLDHDRFIRVHRRVIVAVDRIRAIQPLANGDSTLVLHNGHAIRASRSYRESVRTRWAEVMTRQPPVP